MFLQPLFWLFLPCQFLIFVFIANRVTFHPRKVIPETLWVEGGSLLLFIIQSSLVIGLARAWDFRVESFSLLAFPWKLYLGLSVLGVLGMAADLLVWYGFRLQKVDVRMTAQRFPNRPPRFKLPLEFLKHLSIDNQFYDLEVVQYDLYLPRWPKAFSGLSLVQLSDIHYGKYAHKDYLRMVFEEAKKLKPDLFAFTGDFVSHFKNIAPMRGLLKGFKAPLGVYALLGNHDHWAGAAEMRKVLEADGIKVFKNEAVYLKRKGKTLVLLGTDDYWEGEKDMTRLFQAQGDAKILLAHQPDQFYLAKKLKVHLQISGHCHGGQICFPLVGPLIVPSLQGRKFAGGSCGKKGPPSSSTVASAVSRFLYGLFAGPTGGETGVVKSA